MNTIRFGHVDTVRQELRREIGDSMDQSGLPWWAHERDYHAIESSVDLILAGRRLAAKQSVEQWINHCEMEKQQGEKRRTQRRQELENIYIQPWFDRPQARTWHGLLSDSISRLLSRKPKQPPVELVREQIRHDLLRRMDNSSIPSWAPELDFRESDVDDVLAELGLVQKG